MEELYDVRYNSYNKKRRIMNKKISTILILILIINLFSSIASASSDNNKWLKIEKYMVKELLKLNLKIYIMFIILFVLNKIFILKGCKKTLLFHINHIFLRFFTTSRPFISLTT